MCIRDSSYRCSVRFVRIDSLGRQDGNHVPDYERYGQGYFRYWGSRPGIQANKPPSLCTLGQLCAKMLTLLSRSNGACTCHSTSQAVWPATVRPVHRGAPAQSTDAQSRGHGNHAVQGKNRTGWVVSSTTNRCSTSLPKQNTRRWQLRSRVSGSDVSKKRQSST